MSNLSQEQQPGAAASGQQPQDAKTRALSLIGYILGISYPLLALSTGARGLYQLFLRDDLAKLGPALSVLTAVLYLVAAIGFFKRTPRWWRIAVAALAVETVLVLAVGALSFIMPELIGSTAWRHFGQDYGYFPLIQPLLGLIYLLWKPTRVAFGVGGNA
ncbi:MAG TPA: hypothetical protein PKM78_05355 [Anaerolineae bacterium]|nr:hypothetical protein [Anaerolineae bacterium]HNU03639.1 hypothetical protein [Anaerolineae bacterium]